MRYLRRLRHSWNFRFARALSLGPDCETKMMARNLLLKRRAPNGPFDWQITPEPALLTYFRSDFTGLFEREDLVMYENGTVWNPRIGTQHPHEFPTGLDERKIDRRYASARSRHDYLCERFKRLVAEPVPTIFLYSRSLSDEALAELDEEIARRSGARNFLIKSMDIPFTPHKEWPKNTPQWADCFRHIGPPTPELTPWRKHDPWWPFHRLIDGRPAEMYGQMWRRWNGARWEYKQDEETEDEAQSRVW